MSSTHTLVVGAGQAGLAISNCLTASGIDHVVLERGRTAERWLGHRWEALRLLTPNWASRLPGWTYRGPEPDGFMTADELAGYLTSYAASFDAPIEHGAAVRSITRPDGEFVVAAGDTTWRARNVVLATGWCDVPTVPRAGAGLSPDVTQLTPTDYRSPEHVPDGGVLVVGAGATGVQLADELARAGRDVVLAVGRHSRVPRRYRGMDIWWWLDRIGTFARTIDEVADPAQARREGALQLVGRPDRRNVDLPALRAAGVELVGHFAAADGQRVRFSDDLADTARAADARLASILDRVDAHVDANGLAAEVLAPDRPSAAPTTGGPTRLDLADRGIRTVIWATGYRRPAPWLQLPVLDRHGDVIQRRGATPVPGLYVLGQRFQHRRDSNFIDGVRHDAEHLARRIERRCQPAPR